MARLTDGEMDILSEINGDAASWADLDLTEEQMEVMEGIEEQVARERDAYQRHQMSLAASGVPYSPNGPEHPY